MGELVSFRNIREDDLSFAFSSARDSKYSGAFVKIGSGAVSVQPDKRRILFPHIGYPESPGTHAIAIMPHSSMSMGGFVWEAFNTSSFGDALEFTFIEGSTKNTSWYPSNDNTYRHIHARLYNVTGYPFDYYINGMLGKDVDTDLIQSTSTTIYPGASMSYIHDVPALHANNTRIWISDIASHLETRGVNNVSLIADNRSMYEKDGDAAYDYPTSCAMINNHDASKLIDNDTFTTAKTILLGYLDDKEDLYKHINKPVSAYMSSMRREFLSIRVMRPYIITPSSASEKLWKSNALDVSVPEEVDRIDDGHIELIDGMWVSVDIS